MGEFIERDGTRIHYLRHQGPEPALILLHGLTANAHCFAGLVRAGLCARRAALAVDLRGRGLSDKPAQGYSVAEHAADIIALMDRHGMAQAAVCGHSYGALLTLYLATAYPDRVARMVLMDMAGPTVQNPRVYQLIAPSLNRLGKTVASMDAFLDAMRQLSCLAGFWDQDLAGYYRADVEQLSDGRVRPQTPPEAIQQVIEDAQRIDWSARLAQATQPAVLLHANEPYGPPGTPPIILEEQAREAASLMAACRYVRVPGNHMTMLFGDNARAVVAQIEAFLAT